MAQYAIIYEYNQPPSFAFNVEGMLEFDALTEAEARDKAPRLWHLFVNDFRHRRKVEKFKNLIKIDVLDWKPPGWEDKSHW